METSITTTAPESAPESAPARAAANAAVAVLDPGRVEDGSHAEPLDVEMSYLELFLAASGDVSTVNNLASESLPLSDNKGQCEPAGRSDSTTRTAASPMASASSTTSTNGRKRRIPTATEGSSSDGTHATPAPKTKARVSYSTLQKEEKELLLKEVKYLEAQVAFLQDLPENSTDACIAARVKRENEMLENAARSHQFELAGVQSALSHHSTSQRCPFERYIRLGKDWDDRQATLTALRDQMFRDAEQYNSQRARFLSPAELYSSVDKFTSPSGDLCISNFEICPLKGVSSVKQVYDALRFFYFNMDISFTQSSGDRVVREGKQDSSLAPNASQQRFFRSVNFGPDIESNQLVFGDYRAQDHENGFGREFAVLAVDFVDEDELLPYKPAERLRQDLVATITLKTYPRTVVADSANGSVRTVFDVVLYRSYFLKVHHSNLPVPSGTFADAEHAVELCSKSVLRTVHNIVRALHEEGGKMADGDNES